MNRTFSNSNSNWNSNSNQIHDVHTDVLTLVASHWDTLVYGVPILYMLVLTLVVVKWVLRGPRDYVIDFIYIPETLRLTGRLAHEAGVRSRFC